MAYRLGLNMGTEIFFKLPELSPEDQRLIQAYEEVGVPLDALAYSENFKRLVKLSGLDPEKQEHLRNSYRRLLTLRKQSLLPRVYSSSSTLSDDGG